MGQLELLLLLTAVENTTRGQPCTAARAASVSDFDASGFYLPL
jgi:hypothetical protein